LCAVDTAFIETYWTAISQAVYTAARSSYKPAYLHTIISTVVTSLIAAHSHPILSAVDAAVITTNCIADDAAILHAVIAAIYAAKHGTFSKAICSTKYLALVTAIWVSNCDASIDAYRPTHLSSLSTTFIVSFEYTDNATLDTTDK